jgi:hypothetical protein
MLEIRFDWLRATRGDLLPSIFPIAHKRINQDFSSSRRANYLAQAFFAPEPSK